MFQRLTTLDPSLPILVHDIVLHFNYTSYPSTTLPSLTHFSTRTYTCNPLSHKPPHILQHQLFIGPSLILLPTIISL